ncbi:uncharacterized protein [Centruroides vittatus]|uniref:uncharacterized protein isoform X2 n=1 Tax=Centruroides vittatus TaxID=120091 RepID=UPI00350F88A2
MLLLFMGYLTKRLNSRCLQFALLVIGASACTKTEDCSSIAGNVLCNVEIHRCVCKEGNVYLQKHRKCVQVARLGELCELSEQCQKTDPFSICHFFDSFQLHLMMCQCKAGYEEEGVEKKRHCVPAKKNNFLGGNPHFDSGDAVPIVMGCLAAGLALVACCAGIVQLMRKKNGRTFRREDSQHPHESVALNGLGTYPVINGTPIIMPPPPPLEDCLPVEDLPPSYEEAIKQCAPAIPVPISEPNKM